METNSTPCQGKVVANTPPMAVRFAEERHRLGISQKKLADSCSSNRKTIARYERGENVPGGDFLAVFADIGADVLYILTGRRSPNLSREETALLDNYRHSPDDKRKSLEDVSAAFAQQHPISKAK